ncbi:RsiV family protein [Bacillus sp. CLL-7-23]|uniref:RsiV family protein n=1 Tax=Bacillus changyiensis TaxID=3004103 RepID=A0ABT4X529_9BACI|nr:RsiV family protein [Bacillus changyiensis]MDA7026834.1 RsiV family protein [Bacillus changyiensis]
MKKAMTMLGVFGVLIVFFIFAINMFSQISASQNQKADVQTEIYKNINSLSFPTFSHLKRENLKLVNDEVELHMKDSYHHYRSLKKNINKKKQETAYETSYKVKFNDGEKLSFLIYDYQLPDGLRGVYSVAAYNYDFKKQKRIKLTDLLNTQAKVEKAKNDIFIYIHEHPEQFYSGLKKSDIRLNDNTAFYFTSDGISVVFQQYELSSSPSGNQEVKISY